MRPVLILCALLSVGCEAFREELPGLFAAAPRPSGDRSSEPKSPHRLPQLARQLESKFKPPAMPVVTKENECSGAPPLEANGSDSKQLVLANVDARTQTKNLISRRISERLESAESALLATLLDANPNDLSPGTRRSVPTAALSLTSEDLGRIQKQRYLGVFYITDYQGPALILRVGKIRREWFEGHLRAKFVLFDAEHQRMICSVDLYVTNDAKSAPIRSRLQSETRGRLERELGDALRVEAERSLGRIAQQLHWPDS
jgi:hypothetical protein